MFTLFGASKCIFFGIPMALAILGCGLALLGGDAVVAGSVLHVIVALWIFLSYLLWVRLVIICKCSVLVVFTISKSDKEF